MLDRIELLVRGIDGLFCCTNAIEKPEGSLGFIHPDPRIYDFHQSAMNSRLRCPLRGETPFNLLDFAPYCIEVNTLVAGKPLHAVLYVPSPVLEEVAEPIKTYVKIAAFERALQLDGSYMFCKCLYHGNMYRIFLGEGSRQAAMGREGDIWPGEKQVWRRPDGYDPGRDVDLR